MNWHSCRDYICNWESIKWKYSCCHDGFGWWTFICIKSKENINDDPINNSFKGKKQNKGFFLCTHMFEMLAYSVTIIYVFVQCGGIDRNNLLNIDNKTWYLFFHLLELHRTQFLHSYPLSHINHILKCQMECCAICRCISQLL